MTDDNNTADTVDVIPTVALPRSHFSREIYTGAELTMRPVRAGAADALALPSLFNGKRTSRAEIRELLTAPSSLFTPPPAMTRRESHATFIAASGRADAIPNLSDKTRRFLPVPLEKKAAAKKPRELNTVRTIKVNPDLARTYTPRADSIVGRTLAHLNERGGYLLFAIIDRMFGTTPATRAPMYQQCVRAGMLARVVVDGQGAYALPGYVPPADTRPKNTPGTVKHARHMLGVHARQLMKLENQLADVRTKISTLQALVVDYERSLD